MSNLETCAEQDGCMLQELVRSADAAGLVRGTCDVIICLSTLLVLPGDSKSQAESGNLAVDLLGSSGARGR